MKVRPAVGFLLQSLARGWASQSALRRCCESRRGDVPAMRRPVAARAATLLQGGSAECLRLRAVRCPVLVGPRRDRERRIRKVEMCGASFFDSNLNNPGCFPTPHSCTVQSRARRAAAANAAACVSHCSAPEPSRTRGVGPESGGRGMSLRAPMRHGLPTLHVRCFGCALVLEQRAPPPHAPQNENKGAAPPPGPLEIP